MSYRVSNFDSNDDVRKLAERGQFSVIEWRRDLSTTPWTAQTAWFAAEMDVRRRQLIINLAGGPGATVPCNGQWGTSGPIRG